MDIDPKVGTSLFENIANFLDLADSFPDWEQHLTRLVMFCYDADRAYLLRVGSSSMQLSLVASYPMISKHAFPLTGAGCLRAWNDKEFYTQLLPGYFPEFVDIDQGLINCYLVVPLSREEQDGVLLLLAYKKEPPLLNAEQYHGLRIIAAYVRRRLQGQEELTNFGVDNFSSQQVLNLIDKIFDRAPIMIDGFNREGQCILWNKECERVFGWSAEEVKSHPVPLSVFYPDKEQYQDVISGFSGGSGSIFREWRPRTRDGKQLVAIWANVALPNGDMICIGHDITEQKMAENQRRLTASVFEASYEGIMITDVNNRICDVNPAFTRITGYLKDDIIGHDPSLLSSGQHDRSFYTSIWKALSEKDSWKGEIWNRRKNGEIYPQLLSISVVRDSQEKILHYVAVFSDITNLKNHEAELKYLAHHDALTKVPNRLLFSEYLEKALVSARKEKELLAVCYLDLDGFKPINDKFGHAAGDQLLVVVSERLRHTIRPNDILARLGGDEFAILLSGLRNADECVNVIKRILCNISLPIVLEDSLVRISSSIGVTLFPDDDAEAEILLRHADQAMYQAKRGGKNSYQFYNPLKNQLEAMCKKEIERLEQAFLEEEFILYYQPKVNLLTGEVIGFEALLRWSHPERGILEPADFLPVIAGTRLEFSMGEWVIDAVLRQIQYWKSQGQDISISFNISTSHLMSQGFTDYLETMLACYSSIPNSMLEMELKESVTYDNVFEVAKTLSRCRELGVTIALDDFGTGCSSLSHLKELPIDTIKIAKSFVSGMPVSQKDKSLVKGIVQITQMLGISVIAEGVESAMHSSMLLDLGCPLAQGYGIAEPMPASQVLAWLQQNLVFLIQPPDQLGSILTPR